MIRKRPLNKKNMSFKLMKRIQQSGELIEDRKNKALFSISWKVVISGQWYL